jgi:hypothetical protein
MGSASRILLRFAAFFLTVAIICTISAATLVGGVSADDDPENLAPPISPVPAGEAEGNSSTPPITRNSPQGVAQPSQPSNPQPTAPPATSNPPASNPPASNPPTSTAPVTQSTSSTTTTVPATMPNTGAGFTTEPGLGLRAVLQGVALISILLAVSCASSGLAIARKRISSR